MRKSFNLFLLLYIPLQKFKSNSKALIHLLEFISIDNDVLLSHIYFQLLSPSYLHLTNFLNRNLMNNLLFHFAHHHQKLIRQDRVDHFPPVLISIH